MEATLPPIGSIWKHKITSRLMRVCVSHEDEIILHNCELAMVDPNVPMVCWKDCPEIFTRAFVPAQEKNYPKTAA